MFVNVRQHFKDIQGSHYPNFIVLRNLSTLTVICQHPQLFEAPFFAFLDCESDLTFQDSRFQSSLVSESTWTQREGGLRPAARSTRLIRRRRYPSRRWTLSLCVARCVHCYRNRLLPHHAPAPRPRAHSPPIRALRGRRLVKKGWANFCKPSHFTFQIIHSVYRVMINTGMSETSVFAHWM